MKKSPFLLVVIISLLFMTVLQISGMNRHAYAVSPLTSPVTPPLTSFMHTISGKIVLKKFQWLGGFSKKTPARNVTVTLKNVFTHEVFSVQTNELGMYVFSVPDQGWYQVKPDIDKSIAEIVAPPFRFVKLKKHDTLHEDFQAIDLP